MILGLTSWKSWKAKLWQNLLDAQFLCDSCPRVCSAYWTHLIWQLSHFLLEDAKVGRVIEEQRQLFLQSFATGNRKKPSVSQEFETLSFWKTTWPSSSTKLLVVKPTPKNPSGLTTSGCDMWFILIGKLHRLIQNWNIYLSIPTGTSLFADANNQVSEHRSVLQNARSRWSESPAKCLTNKLTS